jgi:hypothetical protein
MKLWFEGENVNPSIGPVGVGGDATPASIAAPDCATNGLDRSAG